jgi:hypothetical protein
VLCAILEWKQHLLLGSYQLGLELLVINGLIVMGGLFLISQPASAKPAAAVVS